MVSLRDVLQQMVGGGSVIGSSEGGGLDGSWVECVDELECE